MQTLRFGKFKFDLQTGIEMLEITSQTVCFHLYRVYVWELWATLLFAWHIPGSHQSLFQDGFRKFSVLCTSMYQFPKSGCYIGPFRNHFLTLWMQFIINLSPDHNAYDVYVQINRSVVLRLIRWERVLLANTRIRVSSSMIASI